MVRHETGVSAGLRGEHRAESELRPVIARRPPQRGQAFLVRSAGERRGQSDAAPQVRPPVTGETAGRGRYIRCVSTADEPQSAPDTLIDRAEEIVRRTLPAVGRGNSLLVHPAPGLEVGAVEAKAI